MTNSTPEEIFERLRAALADEDYGDLIAASKEAADLIAALTGQGDYFDDLPPVPDLLTPQQDGGGG